MLLLMGVVMVVVVLAVVQVLVGTNVLSEGIDLPECGLVVALDPLQSTTQFVQTRGGWGGGG